MTMFMRWLRRLWSGPREWLAFLKPIRFIIIPLLALLVGLIWAGQGQDAVRALVEFNLDCPRWGLLLGFIATVVFLAFQAWYWGRQLLRVDYPQVGELREQHTTLELWTPRVLGALAFLIAIAALVRTAFRYGGRGGQVTTNIVITVVILAVLLVLFLVFTIKRRHNAPPERVNGEHPFDGLTRWILYATVLLSLLFLVWTAVSPVTAGLVFPSPPLLMFSASLWVAIGSWMVFWIDRYRVPLIGTLLLLAIVFSLWMDNHSVRTLPAPSFQRSNVAATFTEWYGKLHTKYPQEAAPPVFVVATEGGGIRAAYWTAAVLTALQDRAPAFADHTFAISSVSGGSVGTAVFTALVADKNRRSAVSDCDNDGSNAKERATLRYAAQQILSYDALAPTLASMLHADLAQRFLPFGFIPDRQRALEHGWERGWRTHLVPQDDFFGGGMLQMYAANGGQLLPSVFLNGTSVERGNRLIASNCLIDENEIQDARDLFSELGADMPISTAAGNSARFSYVSPAGTVHASGGEIAEHVVDGGYFENSGAQTAADVIRTILAANKRPARIVLIVIHFTETPEPGVTPEHFMNEVFSPPRSLGSTRGARGVLAVQQALRIAGIDVRHFVLAQEKGGIVLPLGWLLAQRTRAAIDIQVGSSMPPNLPPPLVPFVKNNVDNVNAIAAMLLQPPAMAPDPVQQRAMETEKSFLGQKDGKH